MVKDKQGRWQESPVHCWFELSYGSYFVAARSVMERMPYNWQRKFVKLMDEIDKRLEFDSPNYIVIAKKNGRFIKDGLREYRHPDDSLIRDRKPTP